LRAKEAELVIEAEAVRTRIAEYPDLLHDARTRAVYAKPNVRPGSELNGEVAKITARERKDLAALNGLEGDLSAVRAVIATEAARVQEEETAEARAQLSALHEKEEATWKQAGELLGDLAEVWNAYTELTTQAGRFAHENGLNATEALAVSPAPASFRAWLLLLHQASTDADVRAEPFTEQLIDSGIFRTESGELIADVRPAGTRQVEVRRKLDYGDRLYDLIPDLRNVVATMASV
jgi:hypothetical protein